MNCSTLQEQAAGSPPNTSQVSLQSAFQVRQFKKYAAKSVSKHLCPSHRQRRSALASACLPPFSLRQRTPRVRGSSWGRGRGGTCRHRGLSSARVWSTAPRPRLPIVHRDITSSSNRVCFPEGYAAPGGVPCQRNMRGPMSKLSQTPPHAKNSCDSRSPVGDISVVTLIRTDTTLDHSQKAEKV